MVPARTMPCDFEHQTTELEFTVLATQLPCQLSLTTELSASADFGASMSLSVASDIALPVAASSAVSASAVASAAVTVPPDTFAARSHTTAKSLIAAGARGASAEELPFVGRSRLHAGIRV